MNLRKRYRKYITYTGTAGMLALSVALTGCSKEASGPGDGNATPSEITEIQAALGGAAPPGPLLSVIHILRSATAVQPTIVRAGPSVQTITPTNELAEYTDIKSVTEKQK